MGKYIFLKTICNFGSFLFVLRQNNLSYFFYFQVTISLHVLQAEKEQKLVVKETGSASDAETNLRLVSFVIPSLVLAILRLL